MKVKTWHVMLFYFILDSSVKKVSAFLQHTLGVEIENRETKSTVGKTVKQ